VILIQWLGGVESLQTLKHSIATYRQTHLLYVHARGEICLARIQFSSLSVRCFGQCQTISNKFQWPTHTCMYISLAVCDACINIERDFVLSTERFISFLPHCCAAVIFPIPSLTCHRCRKSRLRSLRLLASLHGGRGVSGFWKAPS
jgi:hypothetical protein